jgi:hypothetical protein
LTTFKASIVFLKAAETVAKIGLIFKSNHIRKFSFPKSEKHNVASKFSYKTLILTLDLTAKSFLNDKSYLALPRCNNNSDETISAGEVVLSDFANEALKIEQKHLIKHLKKLYHNLIQ